ncbi:hypothetical protein C8J55DRAFT_494173 [Lentinula edodes]|uniref:Uncharacterized protein n=1 Tax=Lentinula lateritia TaxID=40482 RepID=A0A9W8ZQM3_9AGAR|nr:hypothetical protein C8J55DRAFT_494173 [Lentinula edodes]
MSPRRPSSEDSPPRKRHKELPLLSFDSPETQLTVDGCVSDGGFDGDLSSPIHHYEEIESEMHKNNGSQVEVKNAEQSLDSLYSDDIPSQLPTTSQIEFTASQQSLLNWVDNLSQAQADQEAIYREAELKWLDNSGPGYGGYDEPSNSRHHRSITPPCSDPCVPCRSSSSFNNLGPRGSLDAKDIMLAWYQQRLDSLESKLAIHRAHSALWRRLVGTMAERANDIGAVLNDAVMWGVDEINMPPLPPGYIEFQETL